MENIENNSEAQPVPEQPKAKKYAIWFKNKELKTKFKELRKKEGMKSEEFLALLLQNWEESAKLEEEDQSQALPETT